MEQKKERKKGSGGNREGAGAKKKPVVEIKQQLRLGIKGSTIEKLGGMEPLKETLYDYVYRLERKRRKI